MSKDHPALTPKFLAELAEDPRYADHCKPHWVYRYFQGDRLLYIGFTKNPKSRDQTHRSSSRWYHLVTRRELEEHPHRWAAGMAEGRAIRGESPAFNVQGNNRPDWDAIRAVSRPYPAS